MPGGGGALRYWTYKDLFYYLEIEGQQEMITGDS